MLRLSLLPLLVLLALAALAPPLGLAFVVPLARPGFQKHQPHHHHRRRHAGFQVHASASASASTPPFPFESNVEMLRASLRLLGTHERQKAQDWEASLVDAGREMVIAKMMAQICDTRVALLGTDGRKEGGDSWIGGDSRVTSCILTIHHNKQPPQTLRRSTSGRTTASTAPAPGYEFEREICVHPYA